MQKTISIKQHLTFSEYYLSSVYYFFTRKKVILYIVGLTGVAFIGQLLGPIAAGKALTFKVLFPVFAAIVFVPAFVFLSAFIIGLLMRKTKPYMFDACTYTFNDWGITREGKDGGFAKPWHEITKVRETKNFFLFESIGDAHPVMKRCLSNGEEIDTLRALSKEKIKRK